jgi:UDP-N-acetyl-D-galactosamine dehydrogenase
MKKGAIVVYESTVYPGATEEVCIPILEKFSGLKWKQDFNVGYSPERINPGDKERTVTKIMKVVSGDTPETLKIVADTYGSVITAGVYPASSIKVAEAAKVIENTQRDLNIALMNELSVIFHKIGIDTLEVLKAAGTKWNFLPFRPGLVGGHCIGVDPYYLTHKADMLGYHPQVILAGRRINDSMGKYVAEETVKQMIQSGHNIKGADVIVLGLTFKENCPDLRNSKVIDVIRELQSLRLQRAGARPGGRVRRGRARVRCEPDGLGRSAPCGCHCGCGGPFRVRGAGRGAAVREAGAQRRVHRCEELLRPGGPGSGWRESVAALMG